MDNQEFDNVIVLKFADSKIPVFKESRNKEYIRYGEDNEYPLYLTYLFNKSAKHNAIVTGKAKYIFGEGYEDGDVIVNRTGETLNDIAKKAILDVEIYGGFKLEVIWNAGRKISEIYHVDYTTIRIGKEQGYWYKESWKLLNRETEQFIPAFNPAMPYGNQIYEYSEYRPMTRFYPLPGYIGCNNYIETDIEISKYYLSAIRNGMNPSKMIQFFKGEPTEEKKREIEHRMAKKFAGAENAGKFLLVFNDSNATNPVQVDDLSASDLDKQFVELNKTTQQEIFSGHNITSPMLFGIKTEGQLGGNTELQSAYNIFQNTYAKPKASSFDKELTYLLSYSIFPGRKELKPTDPVDIQFDVKDVINSLPKQFVFERLGIPEVQWNLPNIGGDNKADTVGDITKAPTAAPTVQPAQTAEVNDSIKNLTAKQHQQLLRIIRQYSQGKLTAPAAKTLLRTGLGLSEDDINSLLGIEAGMSSQISEDEVIALFDAFGESKNDFEILKSKKVCFSDDIEAEEDEEIFIQEAFKTFDVSITEQKIIDLIKSDSKITPEVIGKAIGETKSFVERKIDSLIKKGYIETTSETIGEDTIIERIIPKDLGITAPPPTKKDPAVQILVKYSYEPKPGQKAIIPTTRPFCKKLIELGRLYTRAEIESISARLGYSVWDRKGGWWGKNPECRHRWVSNIVIKKK